MLISKKGALVVSLAATSAIALAACGSSKGTSTSPSKPAAVKGYTLNGGPTGGTAGGTLKVLSQGDVSNFDSESMYDTASYSLARLFVRGLYGYKSSNDQSVRVTVQPDLADGQPQISSDGLTYTIKIQQGADWDINGVGRQVTAADAIRGIKMTCNPVLPFGATAYYTQTIAGLADFCTGFGKVSQTDATAIKNYEENTPVSGLTAVDDTTLKITLKEKASDFMHFLALPSASPVNIEQLAYVPDSPAYRQHTYSDGPYRITSYVADKTIDLARNPVWNASTDSLRKAYADTITIDEGGDQDTILQQIKAGTADTTFSNDPLPTTAIPGLISSGDTGIHINPAGSTNPYLVFNQIGGSAAVKNVLVRQAVNYAVDKQAISQVLGGPKINPVINQIFASSVVGDGWEQQDIYSTPNNAGDVAKAKALLTQAGYPNGVTLKFTYRTLGNGPKIAASLKTSLAAAGINLVLKGVVNSNYYGDYLQKPSITKGGDWDVAEPGWGADWEGASERSYFTPLFDGREYGDGSTNYGDYNDPAVDSAADAALAETDPAKSAADWNAIDAMIMKDAPWVPLVENNQVNYVGSRVKNFEYYYPGSGVDLANLAVQ